VIGPGGGAAVGGAAVGGVAVGGVAVGGAAAAVVVVGLVAGAEVVTVVGLVGGADVVGGGADVVVGAGAGAFVGVDQPPSGGSTVECTGNGFICDSSASDGAVVRVGVCGWGSCVLDLLPPHAEMTIATRRRSLIATSYQPNRFGTPFGSLLPPARNWCIAALDRARSLAFTREPYILSASLLPPMSPAK
jgi:hypothetical protein